MDRRALLDRLKTLEPDRPGDILYISEIKRLLSLQKETKSDRRRRGVKPKYINCDTCTSCGTMLNMVTDLSMSICKNCGKSERIVRLRNHTISSVDNKKRNTYKRIPLYIAYLNQFHEDTPKIPDEVISTICLGLSNIHMMLPGKVKRTPIIRILRKNNMSHYAEQSVRIVRRIRGEEIPSMSTDLISRLVHRYHEMYISKMSNACKLPNVRILTRQFLLEETRPDLAKMFDKLAHDQPPPRKIRRLA